jgi:hypothetical protein
MKEEIRKEKLASIAKMKEKKYPDETIMDVLSLDEETYKELLEEYLDQKDPYHKLKATFTKFFIKEMGWDNKPYPKDLGSAIIDEMALKGAPILVDVYIEHNIEKEVKPKVLDRYRNSPGFFTVEVLSELHGVATWKIQEWIDEDREKGDVET